jgi:hypothetical protein
MNKTEQFEILKDVDAKSNALLLGKAQDYATDDVLSNFKRLSSSINSIGIKINTPEGYALFMALMKIDRINNLISNGKEPSNESIEDSFVDGINYLKLAYLCIKEKNDEREKV